ncbi:gag-pol polyprotein [Tanacetum coccineum]
MVTQHDGTIRTIYDVRYVEGLKKNLLSLGQSDDLVCKEAEASVASHSLNHKVIVTWNRKLGHMSEQGMKTLVERKLLPGLLKVSLPFCEHCAISKQHRLKFKTSRGPKVSYSIARGGTNPILTTRVLYALHISPENGFHSSLI